MLQATAVDKTVITQEAALAVNLSTPGTAVISLSSTTPFQGSGAVVEVTFLVLGGSGSSTAIDLVQGSIDEDTVSTCENDGLFGVCASVPSEVSGLVLEGATSTALTWTSQGGGIQYDVVSGTITALRGDGSVVDAACLATAVPTATTVDTRPAPGLEETYYYLVRARNACARGTLGAASSGEERIPVEACP